MACESARVVATHDDAARDVLCGPVRETVPSRGAPAVAPERFAVPILSATPVRRGWVFVTADGTVTRSDTFLGPLHLLGRIPCLAAAAVPVRSAGRVAVLDAAGALWTTDGAAPPTRWRFPSRAISAVFADTEHGAAVLEHGELLTTDDAGRTWSRVDLQREVASQVVLTPRGIVAATSAGTQALTADGARPEGLCLDESLTQPTTYSDPLGRPAAASVRAQLLFQVATIEERCAPAATAPTSAEFESAFATSTDAPGYLCHIASRGGAEPEAPPSRLPAGAPPGSATYPPILTGAGSVDAHAWRTPDGRARLHFAWTGRDDAGPFVGHAGPDTEGLPVRPPDEARDAYVGWEILVEGTSRRGLLLSFDHGLHWAGAGRSVVALGRPVLDCLHIGLRHQQSVALPDGGVAVLQWIYSEGRTLVAALEVGPDGAVRQHRGLIADPSFQVAMSRWGSSLGIVLWRADPVAPSWFHPIDGSPPRRLPRIPLTPPRACSLGAPGSDPDAITFWFGRLDSDFGPATVEDGLLESPGFASPTRYEVEWARGEMCVRAVTLSRGGMGAEGLGGVTMTLSARPGDRFVGSLGDAGTFRVACRASREPPSVGDPSPE